MDNMDPSELYKQSPPAFGHAVLKYFAFDPAYLNLNNGSYGATPRPVLAATDKLTLTIESNPDLFMRISLQPQLIDVRRRLAQLIGADVDEVVLVPNASMGVNTVLRNFEWETGDTLIGFNVTYGSVSKTIRNIGDVLPHPTTKEFVVNFPTTHAEIVANFKEFLAVNVAPEGKKTVVVLDSIVSNPGVRMPWKELVKICKSAGAWSVVDAAHSVGQETDINLSEAQPDFWVSNCHKWLSAKRAVAILYVPKRNQHIVKTSIPTSHAYISPADRTDENFVIQYEWNGTIDWAPYLSAGHALDFRNWLGGEHKINEYCHDLALKGGKRLAEILGTRVMDPDGELTFNMTNVELPLPGTLKPTPELDLKIKKKLLEEHNIYAAYFYHNHRWWTRVSAQIWVELEDFERLGKVWSTICDEIVKEQGLEKTS
ncbi:putative aminotransferase class-V [Lyophyllum shimeji]|uniref:Aminotransferase class-V n=1 Tax=Lyophyllum shimeji TaxID=47721 RepID=A0A9P3PTP4_LYOSH|nr:putative aminotransferase class-V [Lyophyllum shimeji]